MDKNRHETLVKAAQKSGLTKQAAEETVTRIEQSEARNKICGIICNCGPNGEPLACGYLPGHDGDHSWATLPTW